MTRPAAPFPAPPDVVLRAAVASSKYIASAREVVLYPRRNVLTLRDREMSGVDISSPEALLASNQAADVLRPWAETLSQALLPFELEAFSFGTTRPIKNDGAAARFVTIDICAAAEIAARKMLQAAQREIFRRHRAPALDGITNISILRDLTTLITIVSDPASNPRFQISSAPAKAFRAEATDWFAECAWFSLRGDFPSPSAHERLAIEKSFLNADLLKKQPR
jgi:hypothetical protein